MLAIAFDIDGTLANGSHREHFIRLENGRSEKDWSSYFAALSEDTVHEPIAMACRALASRFQIVYITARPGEYIPDTFDWLQKHNLPFNDIYHRAEGDFRPDDIVKIELLKEIEANGYTIVMIFDDRDRVVAAMRKAGYTVAQVREGAF